MALRYFSPTERSLHVVLWFWGLLGYEVVFGFLSGFKSQVATPIIIVGVCMYMRRGRLPWRWVILVPVALSACLWRDRAFPGCALPGQEF